MFKTATQNKIFKKSLGGFTLIEVLIGIFLISIVFLSIIGAYQIGLKVIAQSRNRVIAMSINNQEMEKIRNLSYAKIGIQGNPLFPEGELQAIQTSVFNNIEFNINTEVDYLIDPLDGLTVPEDTCPYDYKKVRVKVSWSGYLSGSVESITDISPRNLAEECVTTGGILFVSAFNSLGEMIPSPLIEIIDPETEVTIDFAEPFVGSYYFALVNNTYKIIVSKNGYSTERTYGIDEIAIPQKPNLIVLEDQLIESSFSIDKLSTFSINTISLSEIEIPDVSFSLQGEKIIGKDISENPIYKYTDSHVSDSNGYIEIQGLEWDSYNFSIDEESGLDLVDIKIDDISTEQPIGLAPETNLLVNLYLEAENSFLINIQNASTTEPIFSAQARLYNIALDYDKIQHTNQNGQTYFIPLETGLYNLETSASGYLDYNTSVNISGDVTKIIGLEQVE